MKNYLLILFFLLFSIFNAKAMEKALNRDMVGKIMSYLPGKDVARFRRLNRFFDHSIVTTPHLNQKILEGLMEKIRQSSQIEMILDSIEKNIAPEYLNFTAEVFHIKLREFIFARIQEKEFPTLEIIQKSIIFSHLMKLIFLRWSSEEATRSSSWKINEVLGPFFTDSAIPRVFEIQRESAGICERVVNQKWYYEFIQELVGDEIRGLAFKKAYNVDSLVKIEKNGGRTFLDQEEVRSQVKEAFYLEKVREFVHSNDDKDKKMLKSGKVAFRIAEKTMNLFILDNFNVIAHSIYEAISPKLKPIKGLNSKQEWRNYYKKFFSQKKIDSDFILIFDFHLLDLYNLVE